VRPVTVAGRAVEQGLGYSGLGLLESRMVRGRHGGANVMTYIFGFFVCECNGWVNKPKK
jgi:hypothetical protein